MTGAGARLRERLAERRVLPAPGVWDPWSARIAGDAGFHSVYIGGNALGLHLAKPQPMVSLTETAHVTARIAAVCDALIVVDAGAGFGDPVHCRQTMRELEAAGAAAIHIDDQPYPKPIDYHRGRGSLADISLVEQRLGIAAAARRDPGTVLIARTDALRVTGSVGEAAARARAFANAGADAILVLDLTPDQLGDVAQSVPGTPILWIGGVAPPVPTLRQLDAAGFAMALYPFSGAAAMTLALDGLWRGLADTGEAAIDAPALARARAATQDIAGTAGYFDMLDHLA